MSLLNPCRRTWKMFTKFFLTHLFALSMAPFLQPAHFGTTFHPQPHLLLYIPCFNHKGFFLNLPLYVCVSLSFWRNWPFPLLQQARSPFGIQGETPLPWSLTTPHSTFFPFGDHLLRCEAVLVLFVLESSGTWDTPVSSPSQDFLFWFLAPNLHGGGLGRERPAGLFTKPT